MPRVIVPDFPASFQRRETELSGHRAHAPEQFPRLVKEHELHLPVSTGHLLYQPDPLRCLPSGSTTKYMDLEVVWAPVTSETLANHIPFHKERNLTLHSTP